MHSTVVVVMQHAGVSIVTIAADYEGPLAPFAFLLPVPADVDSTRVRTIKRGIVARLDEVSAPRFHAFYEQDPCDKGRTEQRWDEKIRAQGRGFLAFDGLPPLDRRYAISNEISAPVTPVFKRAENEFRYRKLEPESPAALGEWLKRNGYVISESALAAVTPYVGKGQAWLFAEVSPEHVELVNARRVELGGIRYVTRQPLEALPERLGLANAKGPQDLVLYVLDREARFQAKNYENRFVPSNLLVESRTQGQVGRAYEALFDAASPATRAEFVTEYAWSTRGCGEPCADAPLGLDELLSLGGDVLEAETASAKERAGEPAHETERDRADFEAHLAELPARERGTARRDHARVLAELGRRRALMARQTYVLSRLHHRYTPEALPRDVELVRAPAVRGGVGVPSGKAGELPRDARPAEQNELQVRFVALERFGGGLACAGPVRYRWGKPWSSEARASRAVPLATDVFAAPRDRTGDRKFLAGLLESPVPELGIDRSELRHASAPPPSAFAAPSAAPSTAKSGCAVAAPGRPTPPCALLLLALSAYLLRAPRPARARR